MALTNAYRKDTGEKVRIPEHWLADKTLGEPFRKTPSQTARDNSKAPTTTSTKAPAAGEKE